MVRFDFIMRILFDYYYDKYLGAFRFVLVSRNIGAIKPLFVCTKANYESGLRAAAMYNANEAFRLNKYENCGKVLKYFDAFELYRASVLSIGTFKISC